MSILIRDHGNDYKHEKRSYLNTEMVWVRIINIVFSLAAWWVGNIIVLSQTFMNTIIINIL